MDVRVWGAVTSEKRCVKKSKEGEKKGLLDLAGWSCLQRLVVLRRSCEQASRTMNEGEGRVWVYTYVRVG